jgi:hypothetical protein
MGGERMIMLTPNDDGTYAEWAGTAKLDVTWIRDSYTEPRGFLFECADCGSGIAEWEMFSCLDGGDAAHTGCVEVRDGP